MSEKLFYLLQVNDALFPIGAYSHSQGLERRNWNSTGTTAYTTTNWTKTEEVSSSGLNPGAQGFCTWRADIRQATLPSL